MTNHQAKAWVFSNEKNFPSAWPDLCPHKKPILLYLECPQLPVRFFHSLPIIRPSSQGASDYKKQGCGNPQPELELPAGQAEMRDWVPQLLTEARPGVGREP